MRQPYSRDLPREQFEQERDQALRTMDLDWARLRISRADPVTLRMLMHRTRLEVGGFEEELMQESRDWLKRYGVLSVNGVAL